MSKKTKTIKAWAIVNKKTLKIQLDFGVFKAKNRALRYCASYEKAMRVTITYNV